MQRAFRIVCRGSRLSLAQASIFEKKLLVYDAALKVEVVVKETRGDAIQDRPLQDIEGIDFFTRDIQNYLLSGEADFAVHSLKDVSGENFFLDNHYAIIEREDPRDVVIFNENVLQKLEKCEKIILGTSSPRRVKMATGFLTKALPQLNHRSAIIETESIRGNVDTRLNKLDDGHYDGIILACAGLNRLLRANSGGKEIAELLGRKKLMILPLFECPPAPGQGAIVAETTPGNLEAIKALHSLNNGALAKAVSQERNVAHRYGSGCHQQFGVIHIETDESDFIFAAGQDRDNQPFVEYFSMDGEGISIKTEPVWADPNDLLFSGQNIVLVGPLDQETEGKYQPGVSQKKLWVAETKTWLELAKKGLWVEGSLEGLGLPFIEKTLGSPLIAGRLNARASK